MITQMGRLLADEHPNHPQALLDRARWTGRSMGPLASTRLIDLVNTMGPDSSLQPS
jgi:hypothetical protein